MTRVRKLIMSFVVKLCYQHNSSEKKNKYITIACRLNAMRVTISKV